MLKSVENYNLAHLKIVEKLYIRVCFSFFSFVSFYFSRKIS